jgi:ABC-type multidrug transport system fused ATPase/permease subunit
MMPHQVWIPKPRKHIQKALHRLMEGRTTFVIAHRLSTLHRADLILVMENGHIAARGDHSTLLKPLLVYAEIYEHQMRPQEHDQFLLDNGRVS